MKKILVAIYKEQGWEVKKAPVFKERFLLWRNVWLGTFFSDELLFVSPKGKTLNEQGAWDRLKKKLQKSLAKSDKQFTELEFEVLQVTN